MSDPINSVWSAYGHRFMSTDDERHESCLACGAMYELRATPDGTSDGEYIAANGDQPQQCTHNTNMSHGYPGERDDSDGATVDHNCNCLFCA